MHNLIATVNFPKFDLPFKIILLQTKKEILNVMFDELLKGSSENGRLLA